MKEKITARYGTVYLPVQHTVTTPLFTPGKKEWVGKKRGGGGGADGWAELSREICQSQSR